MSRMQWLLPKLFEKLKTAKTKRFGVSLGKKCHGSTPVKRLESDPQERDNGEQREERQSYSSYESSDCRFFEPGSSDEDDYSESVWEDNLSSDDEDERKDMIGDYAGEYGAYNIIIVGDDRDEGDDYSGGDSVSDY